MIDNSVLSGASFSAECIQKDGAFYINEATDNPLTTEQIALLYTHGADYYLVRIVGENGRVVYGGPIWVEAQRFFFSRNSVVKWFGILMRKDS